MKRAAMLYCADHDPARFKLLKQRDQLPFGLADEEPGVKRTDYTLDQAFRLRLMQDLIGGESSDESQLNGLGPAYAASMVLNAMDRFPQHPLQQFTELDWWAGLVVLEDQDTAGETIRHTEWYVGELEQLAAWVAAKRRRALGPNGEDRGDMKVVRVFLANVTRAADFVRDRAEDLGLSVEV